MPALKQSEGTAAQLYSSKHCIDFAVRIVNAASAWLVQGSFAKILLAPVEIAHARELPFCRLELIAKLLTKLV